MVTVDARVEHGHIHIDGRTLPVDVGGGAGEEADAAFRGLDHLSGLLGLCLGFAGVDPTGDPILAYREHVRVAGQLRRLPGINTARETLGVLNEDQVRCNPSPFRDGRGI